MLVVLPENRRCPVWKAREREILERQNGQQEYMYKLSSKITAENERWVIFAKAVPVKIGTLNARQKRRVKED